MRTHETSEPAFPRPDRARLRRSAPRWLSGLALVSGLGAAVGCQPDCDRIDTLFAQGLGRPDLPPDAVDRVWRGGSGGLSVLAGDPDPELDPLLDHLFTSTATATGMVRWSLVLGLDRVLVVEHPVPLELGETLEVGAVLDDLTFTGGDGSRTFWDDAWRWTAGGTTSARAVLPRAFETEIRAVAVEGSLQVRQVAPVDLRVGLTFTDAEGAREAYWGDVVFDADFGFDPCR